MLDLQIDDGLGLLRGFAARGAIFFDRLFEIVHRVEIDVGEFGNVFGDIARHREVEQEHRLVPARFQRRLHRGLV